MLRYQENNSIVQFDAKVTKKVSYNAKMGYPFPDNPLEIFHLNFFTILLYQQWL